MTVPDRPRDGRARRRPPLWAWLVLTFFAFFVVAAFADHFHWPWWVQAAGQVACIAGFAALARRRRREWD